MFSCICLAVKARRYRSSRSTAVRDIVAHTPAPPGIKAYVTGAAPLVADQFEVGSQGTAKVTAITIAVIAVMLFIVYRSLVTTGLVLVTVLIEMAAARGVVAVLGNYGIIGLSTYSTNLLTLLAIAPARTTRYFSSVVIRRRATTVRTGNLPFTQCIGGTAHVVLGSGLTIAGAVVLPVLHPPALLPNPRPPVGNRHPHRSASCAEFGPPRC